MSPGVRLQRSDERDVHSQYGEDGVLARIFATLGVDDGVAVEFGAWDGVHLSNTAALRERGWVSVLIEGDPEKVQRLRALEDEKTVVVGAMVAAEGEWSIDAILDRHRIEEVELLSIDIDGDDIHMLTHLRRRPRVICIEFNPTIPPPIAYVNPRGTCRGSSLAALAEVAKQLGYELVYATFCNAFFVRRTDAAAFVALDVFAAYHLQARPVLASLYDGRFLVQNPPWGLYRHAWSTLPVYVPAVPRMLLGWPPTLSRVLLAYLYCAVAAPFFYVGTLVKEGIRQIRWRSRS